VDRFISFVRFVSFACGVFAAAMLAAAIVVVTQMVVLRYFLNESTVWQTEFVTYAIVAATFVGSPYVLMLRGHVNVDLLPLALAGRAKLVLALVVTIASFAFCVVLAATAWYYFHEAWTEGWTTQTVWALPLWIAIVPMPVGVSLLCLQYVADFICLVTGREAPFAGAGEVKA
jgi:TRAP-type C4-dicarboxylate transport system permease small subunit